MKTVIEQVKSALSLRTPVSPDELVTRLKAEKSAVGSALQALRRRGEACSAGHGRWLLRSGKQSRISKALTAAKANGLPKGAARRPKMSVTILSFQDGLQRETVSVSSWGELFDVLTEQYAGITIQSMTVEVR